MTKECNCDRERVCSIIGQCFFTHRKVIGMPIFMKSQIKKARSVKQALAVFKSENYGKKTAQKKNLAS